ncbi:hypothetical protein Tco_0905828, partial [Tanacetum coccineum]
MAAGAMKHVASNFVRLEKFEEVDFRKWQKNMHFSLSSMSVVLLLCLKMVVIIQPWNKSGRGPKLWDSLEAKYMTEDASSKKFLVSNFTNYKMYDSRPVMEQYNELLDFKYTLKHLKEELTLVELGNHLRIEESLKMQDRYKPKGNNVASPLVVNRGGKMGGSGGFGRQAKR